MHNGEFRFHCSRRPNCGQTCATPILSYRRSFEIPCFRLVKRWPAKHPTLQFSILQNRGQAIDNRVNLLTFPSHDFTFLFHFSLLEFPFRFPIHVCTRSHDSSSPSTFISLSLIIQIDATISVSILLPFIYDLERKQLLQFAQIGRFIKNQTNRFSIDSRHEYRSVFETNEERKEEGNKRERDEDNNTLWKFLRESHRKERYSFGFSTLVTRPIPGNTYDARKNQRIPRGGIFR